ncbi:MAG: sigma-70 family RNA polymerase sigma factor [Bacteroidota bacterium]
MTREDYNTLLRIASRHARVAEEAEDLLQDALIVAIEASRTDFAAPSDRKWIAGVLRNLATQQARTAVRRKQRDTTYSSDKPDAAVDETQKDVDSQARRQFLDALPPAARRVAVLTLHGLNKQEICLLLKLSDTAFRQRLTSIRKALGPLSDDARREVIGLAYASRQQRSGRYENLPLGLIRRALARRLKFPGVNSDVSMGTHDPSGHLIIFG